VECWFFYLPLITTSGTFLAALMQQYLMRPQRVALVAYSACGGQCACGFNRLNWRYGVLFWFGGSGVNGVVLGYGARRFRWQCSQRWHLKPKRTGLKVMVCWLNWYLLVRHRAANVCHCLVGLWLCWDLVCWFVLFVVFGILFSLLAGRYLNRLLVF